VETEGNYYQSLPGSINGKRIAGLAQKTELAMIIVGLERVYEGNGIKYREYRALGDF
jgi:hypothetical protein